METITSIPASAVPEEELGGIVAEYLALDRIRIFRRLLVTRFGALALLAVLIGAVVPGFSWSARVGSVALFLLPPAWTWINELLMERRLAHRLERVDGAATQSIPVCDADLL